MTDESRTPDVLDGYRVRKIVPRDVKAAAAVLAVAFSDYPWAAWTVDSSQHEIRLEALYRAVLEHLVVPFGAAWVCEHHTTSGTCVVGVAGWLTPLSNPPARVWTCVEPIEREWRGDRWEQHLRAEEQLDLVRPHGRHWLLGTVGVHPQHRGRGIGRQLLRPGLETAAACGEEVRLETSTATNVAFYQGLGFIVTETVEIRGGGPKVWLMQRPSCRS
jgi:ribosomal protein S18 acetylase RimI-like enzyme